MDRSVVWLTGDLRNVDTFTALFATFFATSDTVGTWLIVVVVVQHDKVLKSNNDHEDKKNFVFDQNHSVQ